MLRGFVFWLGDDSEDICILEDFIFWLVFFFRRGGLGYVVYRLRREFVMFGCFSKIDIVGYLLR